MKKVLHIINGDLYSGAERVQDLLAQNLPEFGYQVEFACVKPGIFDEKRQSGDTRLYEMHMRSQFNIGCGFRLARLVRQNGYDLIHTHTPRTAMVGKVASLLTGVPFIHHVHSPTARDTENRLRNIINSTIEKLSLLGVSALIPVSLSLRDYLLSRGYHNDLIKPVFNGVSTPGELGERGLPDGRWTIGSVALFRPRKGLEVLIEALSLLGKKDVPVRLLAVGPFETPEYEASIKSLCDKCGVNDQVEWTGFCRDVNEQLRRMDLFVLPSIYGEGMPMVILEAMASGVPVVASDVEGIPQVLEHGVDGLVVTPDSATSLADNIYRLIDGQYDWRGMREKAYAKQVQQFSDSSMAGGVAKVYDSILGKRR